MSDDTHSDNDADDARENVNEQSDGSVETASGEPAEEAAEVAEESTDDTEGSAEAALPDDCWDEVARAALEQFDGLVWHDSFGQSVLYVPREQWLDVARWLRDDQGFEICSDICGVDHLLNARRPLPPGVAAQRFEISANFLSMSRNRRLRMLCEVPGDDATVASLTPVYPGVDYSERETFDLFGVVFEGHPDLTRILLPEDWDGWPLRKDDAAARVPVQFKGTATTPDQQSLRRQS